MVVITINVQPHLLVGIKLLVQFSITIENNYNILCSCRVGTAVL